MIYIHYSVCKLLTTPITRLTYWSVKKYIYIVLGSGARLRYCSKTIIEKIEKLSGPGIQQV